MVACVILHNMIIEDERDHNLEALFEPQNIGRQFRLGLPFEQYRQGTMDLEDVDAHLSLRGDLIEHLWAKNGMNNMNYTYYWFCLFVLFSLMDVWFSSATGGLHLLLLECIYPIIDFNLCATWLFLDIFLLSFLFNILTKRKICQAFMTLTCIHNPQSHKYNQELITNLHHFKQPPDFSACPFTLLLQFH
jgi:hypothetical protein